MKLSNIFYYAGLLSVPLSIVLWFSNRGEDGKEADKGERWGIFVGLWVPSLLIMGKVLEDREKKEK